MDCLPPWKAPLRTPQPCDHLIQLYTDPARLTAVATSFLGSGLAGGEAAVIIATPGHAELFTRALASQGFDVPRLLGWRQLEVLDAERCLGRFMVDGMPDGAAFASLITATLDTVRAGGYAKIRLYGEMVNVLWNQNLEATHRLETLWNELLADQQVSLLCAYHIDAFDHHAYRGALHRISRSHSCLIPDDDDERFDQAVAQAFTDVFGVRGDAERLRQLLVSRLGAAPVMPPAQAALFALQDLPASVGEAVLDRARHHYGA
jgi:hypothetical protein